MPSLKNASPKADTYTVESNLMTIQGNSSIPKVALVSTEDMTKPRG